MAMVKVHGCWRNRHCYMVLKQSDVDNIMLSRRCRMAWSQTSASQVGCQNPIPKAQIFMRFSIVYLKIMLDSKSLACYSSRVRSNKRRPKHWRNFPTCQSQIMDPSNPWHKLRTSLMFHIVFMTLFHNTTRMYKIFMLFDDLRVSIFLG